MNFRVSHGILGEVCLMWSSGPTGQTAVGGLHHFFHNHSNGVAQLFRLGDTRDQYKSNLINHNQILIRPALENDNMYIVYIIYIYEPALDRS